MSIRASLRRMCLCNPRQCFRHSDGSCFPVCGFAKQAFLAILPLGLWLIAFSCAQFVPSAWRPGISVDVLPALDELLFDNSLGLVCFAAVLVASGWLATRSHLSTLLVFVPLVLRGLRDLAAVPSTAGDILAFIPYGVLHYISPFLFALYLWWSAGAKIAIIFTQAIGTQNLLGVLTQLLFPTAAPWYNDMYGFAPADYSMPGSPGGLARVDKILGTHMYTSAFNNSPLVFGAMPSLHSGFAVLIMLFAMHMSRRQGSVLMIYVCWQWWATMYLRHHYMVDLFVGGFYSSVTYMVARRYLVRAAGNYPGATDYKLLDVMLGDLRDMKSESLNDQGLWENTILKSRRAGDRDSLKTASLEGVVVEA
ncbi:uncharacterized protein EV422DRAFT_59453 [Fimicolochytrium jonesii]|uniref:uncharacterized protein n=1 Tax=Fimicolochytrium jonesii TaxID=1396493 RepID=UPI0022FEA459|nr:uncharacterized protein EV422DRAFT_59453 [Fimicolochytrium jonesii]KAI8820683.1 hypothetical protein EV422DRAFT_59453 [Fimicolochytrium jonesii]